MSAVIRNILVHADRTAGSAKRAALAGDLADRLKADLVGATAGTAYIPSYAPFGETFVAMQPEVIEGAQRQLASALSEAQSAFRAAVGARDVSWRQMQSCDAATFLAILARSADLVVVGRPVSGDLDGSLGLNPSDLVMSAGRPILIPASSAERLSASRIVVGWKDTRESRRAVADALPFLTRAEEVFLVSAGDGGGADDVAAWLVRHGVQAKSVSEGDDSRAAETLITVARRVDADLVVAGAFGHSRARQWAFGGVTRSLLGDERIAVLLSH